MPLEPGARSANTRAAKRKSGVAKPTIRSRIVKPQILELESCQNIRKPKFSPESLGLDDDDCIFLKDQGGAPKVRVVNISCSPVSHLYCQGRSHFY